VAVILSMIGDQLAEVVNDIERERFEVFSVD
jgi:hypothetical protein